ncbi:MAG: hypothetical protein H6832_13445 [Planctomycetes bacterium]|nr:hypothetical protein [Planctomycetota bacterium]MCB9919401.1 hypothetical protein [Planctomycetota bacterium]
MVSIRRAVVIFAGIVTWAVPAHGQILRLVKDIDPRLPTGSVGAAASQVNVAGDKVFFVLQSRAYGSEVWVADATSTRLVKDIRLGASGSDPRELVVLGTTLFFTADDGIHGRELWKSDGTPGGTKLLDDLRPGATTSSPRDLRVFQNRVGFVADDGLLGAEIYFTQGGKPELKRDIQVGARGSNPLDLTVVDDKLFFSADDGVAGRELWRFSNDHVTLVSDVIPGPLGSGPRDFGPDPRGPGVVFSADLAGRGRELMLHREGKLFALADLNPSGSSNPSDFVGVGSDKTFFVADNGTHGRELFVFDATSLRLVKDLRPGSASSNIRDMQAFGDKLVFVADDLQHGAEVWITDGSSAGTVILDLRPGSASSRPEEIRTLGAEFIFRATLPNENVQLCVSDGTLAGTRVLARPNSRSNSNPRSFAATPSQIFCIADLDAAAAQFVTIDRARGTVTHPRLLAPDTFGSDPRELFPLHGTEVVLFQASTLETGAELFRSDGTPNGTFLVKDLSPGGRPSNPHGFVALEERVFFLADERLFETDGTNAGTVRHTGDNLRLGKLGTCGDKIIVAANDFVIGQEPYVFDTDTKTITLLRDLVPGVGSSLPADFVDTNVGCFFAANVPQQGRQLFLTDGTVAGTRAVTSISNGGVQQVTGHGDGLVLFVANLQGRPALHISDGTAANTKPVLASGSPIHDVTQIVALPGQRSPRAFAIGRQGTRRHVFTIGASSARVVAASLSDPDLDPSGLVAAGNSAFWSATAKNGREVFLSKNAQDARGTGDLAPGDFDAILPGPAIAALGRGSEAVFVADDGIHGQELWTSSGSAATTRLLVDAVPGAEGLQPRDFVQAGGLLFFVGDDGVTGPELYVLDQRPLGASLAVRFGKRCKIKGKAPEIGIHGVPELGSIDLGFVAKGKAKTAPAALFFGAQRIAVGVGPCQLSVATLFTLVGVTDLDGKVEIPIPVPNDTKLLGSTLQTQFAVFDPTGSVAGILDLSDAMEVVVGKRSAD